MAYCCRLEAVGVGVGLRLLELLCQRERASKRDIRLLDALKFVSTTLWKYLFGHQARDLEHSTTVSVLECFACTVMKTLQDVLVIALSYSSFCSTSGWCD